MRRLLRKGSIGNRVFSFLALVGLCIWGLGSCAQSCNEMAAEGAALSNPNRCLELSRKFGDRPGVCGNNRFPECFAAQLERCFEQGPMTYDRTIRDKDEARRRNPR